MAKILIVEDDVLLSKMYATIFSTSHYEVETATDGQDALDRIRAAKPHLILLDIMMPKLNGVEVLKKIKADPELKSIPVVILTNLAGANDAQTALEMGAVRYIVKSELKPREVEQIVRGILDGYTRGEIPPAAA